MEVEFASIELAALAGEADLRSDNEDCFVCGVHMPPGHVVVRDEVGLRKGRVCSSHTLWDVVKASNDRWIVDIIWQAE